MLSINPCAPHGPLGWFAHQPSAIRIRQGRPGYRPSCQQGGGHLRWHLADHLGATYSLAIHLFISCPWAFPRTAQRSNVTVCAKKPRFSLATYFYWSPKQISIDGHLYVYNKGCQVGFPQNMLPSKGREITRIIQNYWRAIIYRHENHIKQS